MNHDWSPCLLDDSGFSLSELLIVCVLLGLVLGLAWTFSFAVTQGSETSSAIGVGARETGQPLQLAEKYVMQALDIEEAGPYRLQYRIDRDLGTSGICERHVLEVGADGELRLTVVKVDAAFNPISSPSTSVLLTHSVNVEQGKPLFRYYDSDEIEVTSMDYAPSRSRSIRIGLEVEENERVHSDSRLVSLRNRE